MSKYIFMLIILMISSIFCGNKNSDYWNNIIQKKAPQELKGLRVINRNDINDKDNLEAFDKYNPDIIMSDDFNNNGKEDFVIPCISKSEKNKWYVLIFEKNNNNEYNFVQYFKFDLKSLYIFKLKGKGRMTITLGESFASDAIINIFWKDGRYVRD